LFQTISNKKSKEIRIWSAACAGGQESYSLSMLLHEMSHFNDNQLNYRIFATDQNKQQIEDASIGLFAFSNIQNVTVKRLHNWFKKINNDSYQINHEIKTAIEFSEFDLFNEHLSCPPSSIFGEFDIVFCANLLFYYNRNFQLIILNKVNKSLKKGGYLIVGEVERNIVLEQKFREVYPMSAIFYKKE
jgi:chemotaxis methyl-accepting protein methylase